MEFIFHEKSMKLFPNKTHTPKELLSECGTLEIPTDKPGLQAFIQELLDKIQGYDQSLRSEVHNNMVQSTKIEPTQVSPAKAAQLTRQQIESQWDQFPLTWKLDMATLTLEEARVHYRPPS